MTSPSNSRHVVVGAGPIGSAVATELASSGEQVRLVTRSGAGPEHANIERVAADASDAARLSDLAVGAHALYNCANPRYSRWAQDWPPLAASLLSAAESSDAVLVTASNIYGYGPVSGRFHEDLPLVATFTNGRVRADMYRAALAAYNAGRIRMVEVRGADYFGPGSESHIGRPLPALLAGKTVRVLGNPELPHSWTYTLDMAHALVTLGADERSYGRAWHAPSTQRSQHEALDDLARVLGVPQPKVEPYPHWVLSALGVVNPDLRPLKDVVYQVESPYTVDDHAIRSTFGLDPTEWDTALASYRQGA